MTKHIDIGFTDEDLEALEEFIKNEYMGLDFLELDDDLNGVSESADRPHGAIEEEWLADADLPDENEIPSVGKTG